MKAKDEKEKQEIKLRFAVTIFKILINSTYDSARKFALGNGMEPAHVQKLIREPKDVTLITIISLADGFGITLSELGKYYESVTHKDYEKYYFYINEQKKKSNQK